MSAAARLRSLLAGESGYSLTELITVMTILGVVMSALTMMLVQGANAELDMNLRFQAQTNARTALDTIRREVHCASIISPTGASGEVELTMPAACPNVGGTSVTWCTTGSGTRWALWRYSGTSCGGTGGRLYADYLTTGTVFNFSAQSASTLAKLNVSLPVDLDTTATGSYKLEDDIVLRNSQRL